MLINFLRHIVIMTFKCFFIKAKHGFVSCIYFKEKHVSCVITRVKIINMQGIKPTSSLQSPIRPPAQNYSILITFIFGHMSMLFLLIQIQL